MPRLISTAGVAQLRARSNGGASSRAVCESPVDFTIAVMRCKRMQSQLLIRPHPARIYGAYLGGRTLKKPPIVSPDDFNTRSLRSSGRTGAPRGPWAGTTIILTTASAPIPIERVSPLGASPRETAASRSSPPTEDRPPTQTGTTYLKAHPRIQAEVGTQTFTVLAQELDSTARAELWPKLVAQYPTVGEYQTRTPGRFRCSC